MNEEERKNRIWIVFRGTRVSSLKGWFSSLEEAKSFLETCNFKERFVIVDNTRSKILFDPKK